MPYRWVNGPFVGASDTVQRAFGSDVVLSSEPLNKLAEKKIPLYPAIGNSGALSARTFAPNFPLFYTSAR